MTRISGLSVTICGCLLFIVAFCFLPYLVVPASSYDFTALQLVLSGPHIPLPHYFIVDNIQGVLQNNLPVWQFMVLLVLIVFCTLVALLPNRRLTKIMAWTIIIGSALAFLFSLCDLTRNIAEGFDFLDAHMNTMMGNVYGSLFTIGLLGIWSGLLIALIGSIIILRSRS